MALWHNCHTCGKHYECTANYCPGCGKRLGRQPNPPSGSAVMFEHFTHPDETWWRCSNCHEITEVYNPRFCPRCGIKIRACKEIPKTHCYECPHAVPHTDGVGQSLKYKKCKYFHCITADSFHKCPNYEWGDSQ